MKKQQGVAAIILVLVLIPLFGSVFFALEGTRFIQKKTRLADATEAAAIAVTDKNPNKLNIYTEKSKQNLKKLDNYPLASDYIKHYVKNIHDESITITPELMITKDNKNDSYFQYNVDATTTHNSWFYNKIIPSFKETQNITANSLARNYPKLVGDQPIDLVFVADFSGSMKQNLSVPQKEYITITYNNKSCKAYLRYNYGDYYRYICNKPDNNGYYIYKDINNSPQKKITALKNSINSISKEILKNKDNRVSFTAFSSYTYEFNSKNKYNMLSNLDCYSTEMISKIDHNNSNDYYYDDKVNNPNIIGLLDYKYYYDRYYKENKDISYYLDNNKIVFLNHHDYYNNKDDFFNAYLNEHGFKKITANFCHYNSMVENIFIKSPSEYRASYISGNSIYNINLTSDEGIIYNDMDDMLPQNSTSAYEGIMRGAQILNKGKYDKNNNPIPEKDYNKRKKILILLSDGLESRPKILKNLVKNNLCGKIRQNFSTNNNKMFMGMIGIGYQASDNDVFHQCFDDNIYNSEHQLISESNIIDVDDLSTLTDKIKELIRKGQQTDGISKLSDGQN
ncbi:pilus assembly protein TadG-related protein [Photobacterium toruni]|uniref:Pilus assembly protein TadG-related protein n=1 Tax=Photobacterium toruni TaxID=1935446 RepID=A0ABU6L585_9GAMM|nr:pilus assembly protein TadG-related protein [Photobacterium toruni]